MRSMIFPKISVIVGWSYSNLHFVISDCTSLYHLMQRDTWRQNSRLLKLQPVTVFTMSWFTLQTVEHSDRSKDIKDSYQQELTRVNRLVEVLFLVIGKVVFWVLGTSDHGIYPFHRRTLSPCLYALRLLHYDIHFSSARLTSSVTNGLCSGTPLRLAWIICCSSSIDITGKAHSVVSLVISCERWLSLANEALLVKGLDLLITMRKKHELHHYLHWWACRSSR